MSPFPLFHLPLVPIRNILDLLTPFQLIELSKTSKKAATQVKLRASKNLRISLNFNALVLQITSIKNPKKNSKILISEEDSANEVGFDIPPRSSNCHNEANPDYEETIIFVTWNERFSELEAKGFYVADILGCPIHDLQTDSLPTNVFLRVVQSILKRQNKLNSLNICSLKLQENQLIEVLGKLKITGTFTMDFELSPQFPFQLFNNLEKLEIEMAHWFTLNMILQINCKKIKLSTSRLSNKDLDVFLTKWMRGELPNLSSMYMIGYALDDETPIIGMVPPIVDMENKEYKNYGQLRVNFDNEDGVKIINDDGMVATIKHICQKFHFTV